MPLTANFIADFSSFLTATGDATAATEKFVDSAGAMGRAVDESIAATVDRVKSMGASLVEFGKNAWTVVSSDEMKKFAGDVKDFVSGYVSEFAESELATARMQAAIENWSKASGGNVDAVMAQYNELAGSLQKVSRFSDEAIADTISTLTTMGKVAPEQMEKTLKATMDLATAMKMDLPAATKLMAKAASSDGESLGKLKAILGDSVEKGDDFNKVVEAISQTMGGAFAKAADTTQGKIDILNNQFSDFNEKVGEVLSENLKTVLDLFNSLPEGVQTFAVAAVSLGTALAPILVSFSSLISLIGTFVGAQGIAAAGAAIVAFLPWLAAIVAAVAAVYYAWKYWDEIVAWTKKAVGAIGDYLVDLGKELIAPITYAEQLYNGIKTWLYDALVGLIDKVVGLPGRVTGAFKNMFNALVGHSIVPETIAGIGAEFMKLPDIMVVPAEQSVEQTIGAFDRLQESGLASVHYMTETIADEFATLPDAMVAPLQQAVVGVQQAVADVQQAVTPLSGFAALAAEGFAPAGLPADQAAADRDWNMSQGLGHLYAGRGASLPGYSPDSVRDFGWGAPSVLSPDAQSAAWGRGTTNVNTTVNMSGMLDTNDPQTRARVGDLVSDSVMQGMRNGRLLGTA